MLQYVRVQYVDTQVSNVIIGGGKNTDPESSSSDSGEREYLDQMVLMTDFYGQKYYDRAYLYPPEEGL